MEETGLDFCLDVHGDEALPYNFIAGAEGVEKWSDTMATLQKTYKDKLVEVNPDFQTQYGYEINAPRSANLTICTNYIAQAFDSLAMTLEMPFKDNNDAPCETYGWSPEKSKKLGRSNLDALYSVIDHLK